MDHLAGSGGYAHLRRADGRLAPLDLGSFFVPYAEFAEYEQELMAHARGEVLDLGCGAGRAVEPLLAVGRRGGDGRPELNWPACDGVTAVDISPGACECVRRRLALWAPVGPVEVVCADWRRLAGGQRLAGRFDTVLCLGAGAGLASDPPGLGRLLDAIWTWLRPGGLALLTGAPPPDGARGPSLTSRLRVEYRGMVGRWFDWLYLDPGYLAKLARRAGFAVVWGPSGEAVGDRCAEYGLALRRPVAGERLRRI